MFSSVRYLATVRRAMTMPFSWSIFTISWSDSGLVGVFLLENFGNHVLHAGVGHAVAAGGLDAGGEEIFHLENALRRLHVFAGNGAAHGRFMHAHDFGHLHHRQRFEEGHAFFHELALTFHDFLARCSESSAAAGAGS